MLIVGAKVNGRAFLKLNESRLEKLNVSLGFQLAVLDVIDELVCIMMLQGLFKILILHACSNIEK